MSAGDPSEPEPADQPATDVAVRAATPDDALTVRRVLDAALLEHEALAERIEAGDILVAGDAADGSDDHGTPDGTARRVYGAVVLEPRSRAAADVGDAGDVTHGAHVAAIAVRKRQRDRGVGTALIRAAANRRGSLTARFDERVRPFYESLGFEIERIGEERYEGVFRAGADE